MVAERGLVSKHAGLRKRAGVVAGHALPCRAGRGSYDSDMFVSDQRRALGISVLFDTRVLVRRYVDVPDFVRRKRHVYRRGIIRPVAPEAEDGRRFLQEEIVHRRAVVRIGRCGDDRPDLPVSIDADVDLRPGAALAGSVLPHLPFAFAKDLRAGRAARPNTRSWCGYTSAPRPGSS